MHVNESSENYLETILMLSKKLPVVRAVDIATELNFKKSSVSVAMKKLRESEHIIVSREGYITSIKIGYDHNAYYCSFGEIPLSFAFVDDDIGKIVFFTQEEAEKVLASK